MKKFNKRRGGSKFPKRRDPAYCEWVRQQPCLLGGGMGVGFHIRVRSLAMKIHQCDGPVQVCHVKSRGAGGDDRRNVIAMCAKGHDEQHRIGIRSFEKRWGVDLKAEAEKLDAEYRDVSHLGAQP